MASSHVDPHPFPKDCACDQEHDHTHDHQRMGLAQRWLASTVTVVALLFLLRPFIAGQLLLRATSYSGSAYYDGAVRICKKIIAIDKDNKQAWTSLGYAYMDLAQTDLAIKAFEKVLTLDPNNKGAACFELGHAYYLKGDIKKAIGYFERVRSAGPRAAVLLDADILKYRHGTLGLRSLNSMQSLLGMLLDCYKKTGNTAHELEVQKEYEIYKRKHSKVLF